MGLYRLMRNLAKAGEGVGVIAIWLMLLITMWDVVGAKVFQQPLRGATEAVGLAQLLAIGSGMAMTLLLGRHIHVEFLLSRMPPWGRRAARFLASLLGFVLLLVVATYIYTYGQSLVRSGEILPGLGIPLYPFAYAFAVLLVFASLYFLVGLFQSLAGQEERA